MVKNRIRGKRSSCLPQNTVFLFVSESVVSTLCTPCRGSEHWFPRSRYGDHNWLRLLLSLCVKGIAHYHCWLRLSSVNWTSVVFFSWHSSVFPSSEEQMPTALPCINSQMSWLTTFIMLCKIILALEAVWKFSKPKKTLLGTTKDEYSVQTISINNTVWNQSLRN